MLRTLSLTLLTLFSALAAMAGVNLATLSGTPALYRIKGSNGQYLNATAIGQGLNTQSLDPSNLGQVWYVQKLSGAFVLMNVKAGATPTIGTAPLTLAPEFGYYWIDAASDSITMRGEAPTNNASYISHDAAGQVVRSNSNAATARWEFEPATDIPSETALQAISDARGWVRTPEVGKTYRIFNFVFPSSHLAANISGRVVVTPHSAYTYEQVWRVQAAPSGGRLQLQNVLHETSIRQNGDVYQLDTNPTALQINAKPYVPYFTIEGSGYVYQTNGEVKRLSNIGLPAHWLFIPATVDTAALALQKVSLDITHNRNGYNTLLARYFTDSACTDLRADYRAMTPAALTAAMQADGLPQLIIDAALRVHADTWSSHPVANRYEKDFRIHAYKAYSQHDLWNARPHLIGGGNAFSRLTNPTGITLAAGQPLLLFVDQDPPANVQLKAELVTDFRATGTQVDLTRGVNSLTHSADAHVYIFYETQGENVSLATVPDVKIHIEGGRVNGYYDLERHDKEDWTAMRGLKSEGFLQDIVWRMKSQLVLFSFHRQRIEWFDDNGHWQYNGVDYGMEGPLQLWDKINREQLEVLNAFQPRFADRWRNLYFAASDATSNPHASSYGTHYMNPQFSYQDLTRGRADDHGAPLWVIAHETGHMNQSLINIVSSTEVSNNFLAQVNRWKQGSNVGNGPSLQAAFNDFHAGFHYANMELMSRSRMYFQLYLYYEVLGHRPGFFQALTDSLRATPLQFVRPNDKNIPAGSGLTDYLRFAKFACDVAQEDLSDFFEFWGMFRPLDNAVLNDAGKEYVAMNMGYGNRLVTTTQAEIDSVKAYMAKYPKRRNLFFLDERIKPYPASYPGAPEGAVLLSTRPGVTPGVASQVGELGMFTDYSADNAGPANVTSLSVEGRVVTAKAENAVGYKILDLNNNLVFVTNMNEFAIPTHLNRDSITIWAAGSNGVDDLIFDRGEWKKTLTTPTAEIVFDPALKLHLSTHQSQTAVYHIQNASLNRYVSTSTTPAATDGSDKGRFALIKSAIEGQVYLYNLDSLKWVSYNSLNEGSNLIYYVEDKGDALLWRILPELRSEPTFDIVPAAGSRSWNWYGGVGGAHTSVGLYNAADGNSSWRFVAVDPRVGFKDRVEWVDSVADLLPRQPFYPSQAAHATFDQAVETARAQYANTAAAAANLATFNAAYQTLLSRPNWVLPTDGKAYRIRHFRDGRYLSNVPSTDDGNNPIAASMTTTADTRSIWVLQRSGNSYYLASAVGDGYLTVDAARRAQLTTTLTPFTIGLGSKMGMGYLRTNNLSLAANATLDANNTPLYTFIGGVRDVTAGNGSAVYGTDFYLEEVPDFAVALRFASAQDAEGRTLNLATAHLPFAIALPEGYTAHLGTLDVTTQQARFAPIEGRVLPALTPAIIQAPEAGTLTLAPAPYQAPLTTAMSGTLARTLLSSLPTGQRHYVLALNGAGSFAFRPLEAAAIPANRAYFSVATTAGVRGLTLRFDDAPFMGTLTGLNSAPTTPSTPAPIYDLSGRRLAQPQRGLNIVGGKKVVH